MRDSARTQSMLDLIADAGMTTMEQVTESAERGMVAAFDAMVEVARVGVVVEARMYDKKKGTWGQWYRTHLEAYNPKGSEGTDYIVQYRRFAMIPLDPPKEKT